MTETPPPVDPEEAPETPSPPAEAETVVEPTPIYITPRTRTIILVASVVALILLIREAPAILTIGLGGGFLALILSFPVRLLSRVMPRGPAILLTLLVLLGSLVVGILFLVPMLIDQLGGLIAAIPGLATEGERLLREIIRPLQERGLLSENTDSVVDDLRTSLVQRASQIAESLLDDLVAAVTSVADLAIKAFGIVFVAIYLLLDVRRMKAAFLSIAPANYRRDALVLWDDFGTSLSRYLGGLAVSLLVQGILSGLALWFLGVPYALLLGAFVSVTAIIPYLGAFLGAAPAVILAFYQSPTTGVLTIILYIVIQQVESNLLTPRIQGQAVRVHPIIILLTVIAASEIDGLRGAIFAVPTLAVMRVLLDFFAVRLRVRPTVEAVVQTDD